MGLRTAHLTTSKSGGAGKFVAMKVESHSNYDIVDFWKLFWKVGLSFSGWIVLIKVGLVRQFNFDAGKGRSVRVSDSLWRQRRLLNFFKTNYDNVSVYRVTNFLSIQELVAILNLYPQASIHLVDNAILTPYCHFISGCKEFTRGCALCPKTSNSGRSKVALDDKIMLSSLKQLMAKITFYAGLPLEEQQVRQSYWNLNGSTEILIEPVVYKPSFHRQSVVRTPGRLKVLIASAHPTTRKGFDLIPSLTSELERHGLDQFIELVVCTKLNAALRRLEPERLKVRLVESMPLIKFEELMSECDVFLSLSREDSGPFTINMALALGLKVFSFDVGIAPYFKNLGRDVSIVDIIDIGALVQRLKIELCD